MFVHCNVLDGMFIALLNQSRVKRVVKGTGSIRQSEFFPICQCHRSNASVTSVVLHDRSWAKYLDCEQSVTDTTRFLFVECCA